MTVRATEIRLVIFDWAGTTIDFGSRAPVAAFVQAFAARGVDVTPAEARAPMGLHKKDHLRAMLQMPTVVQRWAAVHARDWTEDDLEALYRDLVPRQLAVLKQHGKLVPGLKECLGGLRTRDVRIGATTGYFRSAADMVASLGREQGYDPECSVCADDVPAGRPEPWMVFEVMKRLRLAPPASVVKVGDTALDVEEGLAAGTWSVGVTSSGNKVGLSEMEYAALAEPVRKAKLADAGDRLRAAGAHAVIETLAELPRLVDELTARLRRGERP